MRLTQQENYNVKQQLIEDYQSTCQICNGMFDNHFLELDHITPVALGGQSDISNLQILCFTCHKNKTREDKRQIFKNKLLNDPLY